MTVTDRSNHECRPWNNVIVPRHKCDFCEYRFVKCHKREERYGWLA